MKKYLLKIINFLVMSHKITLKNVLAFVEGNVRMRISNLEPQHIQEQIGYRMLLCTNDCAVTGKCIICNCNYPERIYTTESCNQERFPNLVSKPEWEEFKIINKIE